MKSLQEAMLEAARDARSPKEGTRAAQNRIAAKAVNTSWKRPPYKEFYDRIRAHNTPEVREALVEDMLARLLPLTDTAAEHGELYMEIRVPACAPLGEKEPIIEEFLTVFEARLDQEGYGLFRTGVVHCALTGSDCTELAFITW